jgi:hypothetical protein
MICRFRLTGGAQEMVVNRPLDVLALIFDCDDPAII